MPRYKFTAYVEVTDAVTLRDAAHDQAIKEQFAEANWNAIRKGAANDIQMLLDPVSAPGIKIECSMVEQID